MTMTCRGCWELGTACGHCEKCLKTKPNAAPESITLPNGWHFEGDDERNMFLFNHVRHEHYGPFPLYAVKELVELINNRATTPAPDYAEVLEKAAKALDACQFEMNMFPSAAVLSDKLGWSHERCESFVRAHEMADKALAAIKGRVV